MPADHPAPSHVRTAVPADAAAIGELQLRAWRSGYAERLPPGALDGLTAGGLAASWAAAAADPPTPAHRVLVSVDGSVTGDGPVTGFAALGPATDPDLGPEAGELLILVVDPDATRRGHGSRLLNAAMDHLRGAGFVLAVTWVLGADDALRALLYSSGWAADGAWRELATDESRTIKQIRLHTSLD